MKKILLFLFLIVSSFSFAIPQGNDDKNVDLTINAKVIKPLTLTNDTNMEFGELIAGSEDVTSNSINYKVIGEPNQLIFLTVKSNIIELKNSKGDKMNAYVMTQPDGKIFAEATLDGGGNFSFSDNGFIPKVTEKTGQYTGTLNVVARYK